ncbi:MAG: EAL domain-containing protein (putative c-di-GMP-specific phosphodiesterase class I) [Lentisphaeria bacterium]|jgi:EAL domain-containing protein (putative c-di-GMP-specific phosphodiesterase class I)/GGDEF domain-containing protein
MSLYKQLWLAIAFLMSLTFAGSFIVNCMSAKAYLEEQLYRKNIDNASALALSLSRAALDTTMIELHLNSQYDTGHYELIRLVDANGEVIAEQGDDSNYHEAPHWLIALFPIEAKAGIAQVSNGWQQVGTLTLISNSRFAYKQLWNNAKRSFYYFVLMAIAGSAIGTYLLQLIIQPLHRTVAHAEAIGERRFIITKEPRTLEFKAVIRSMNKLSQHVKHMLSEESLKLERLRQDIQHDKLTALFNREPILNQLRAFLKNEDETAHGAIVAIRVFDLFHLNKIRGRKTIDALLQHFGSALLTELIQRTNGVAGRLNGSDFLIVLPSEQNPQKTGNDFHSLLSNVCRELAIKDITLLASSTAYHAGENVGKILERLDSVIESAAAADTSECVYVICDLPEGEQKKPLNWQAFLERALKEHRFILESFPVVNTTSELIHSEAPLRLIQEGDTPMVAGMFMPHISRLGMGTKLDLWVAELALKQIKSSGLALSINLSASILSEPQAMETLAELLKSNPDCTEQLWLEIPEYGAFQNMAGFRVLCHLLKPLKCKIGIEHVAKEVTRIGEIHDLGLDFVKIDRSIIHDIDSTTAYQVFLRGLCSIVHSIGLSAIAEGVETKEEWLTLIDLGIDGGTGIYFPRK